MFPLFRHLLPIDEREAEFSRRGFSCARPEVRERLEHAGVIFLRGYHAAMKISSDEALTADLEKFEPGYRGFSYEGAAMAMALQDGMVPRSKRLKRFMIESGKQHRYMLHVGAGWAAARLPWLRYRIESYIQNFDPVLRWLVVDGYGFHEGYFHFRRTLKTLPHHLSATARSVYYQGFGRSLWFVCGADFERIANTVDQLPHLYHADAWSGIGLACAYAGGASAAEIRRAANRCARFVPAMAQGAAFAAKARELAGNPAEHTNAACVVLCGMSAETAAALCGENLQKVEMSSLPSPYQQWRMLLQHSFPATPIPRGDTHEILFPQVASAKFH